MYIIIGLIAGYYARPLVDAGIKIVKSATEAKNAYTRRRR